MKGHVDHGKGVFQITGKCQARESGKWLRWGLGDWNLEGSKRKVSKHPSALDDVVSELNGSTYPLNTSETARTRTSGRRNESEHARRTREESARSHSVSFRTVTFLLL